MKRKNIQRSIRRYLAGLERSAQRKATEERRLLRTGKITAIRKLSKISVLHREGCPALLTGFRSDCDCNQNNLNSNSLTNSSGCRGEDASLQPKNQ
jgi:hypothetical protein